MNIHPLLYMLFIVISASAMASDDYVHLAGAPFGTSFVDLETKSLQKKIQITGTLNPLSLLINGEDSVKKLQKVKCTKRNRILLNGKPVKTKNRLGYFFLNLHEFAPNSDQLDLTLSPAKGPCHRLNIPLQRSFFDKVFKARVVFEDEEVKWPVKFELIGEIQKNSTMSLDKGSIEKIDDTKIKYSVELNQGEQFITGIAKYDSGEEVILSVPTQVNLKKFSPADPVLSLENDDGVDWNKKEIILHEGEDEIEIEGLSNPESEIVINGDVVKVDDDGEFDYDFELSGLSGKITIEFGKRKEEWIVRSPQYVYEGKWYSPRKMKRNEIFFAFQPGHILWTESVDTNTTRFKENLYTQVKFGWQFSDMFHVIFMAKDPRYVDFHSNGVRVQWASHSFKGLLIGMDVEGGISLDFGVLRQAVSVETYSDQANNFVSHQRRRDQHYAFSASKRYRIWKQLYFEQTLDLLFAFDKETDKFFFDFSYLGLRYQY